MTREELTTQVNKLKQDMNAALDVNVRSLIASGGLPIAEEPTDSYGLAKCVLTVALENIADSFAPAKWDHKRQEIVRNLRHF